jgi:ABC-2 type transport system ATP-binding protein
VEVTAAGSSGRSAEDLAEGPPPIRVEALCRSYRRGRIRAVRGVSFEVARGEVFGLIGPDGAGKTSVLQVLAGVLRADSGTAQVAGVDVLRDPEAVKAVIGYMPQGLGLNLYDSLTVRENIEFFRDLRRVPREQYADNRERLLRMTRLERFLERPAATLSGGMRQKLALICTLIHLPDVLLLDEPTTGVDPISRRDFWSIIHALVASRGVTVLMTTAYMDEAERCHRVSLMHDGVIIAAGSPDDLTAGLVGQVWSVRSDHPDDVAAALRAQARVRSIAIAGGEVRVLAGAPDGDPTGMLSAAGLTGFTVEPVRPGFEDVFVERVTREGPSPAGAPPELVEAARPRSAGGAIVADRLTCRFGAFTAVDGVSLTVDEGEILGLLGPNGAGKTTLIKMLCGLQAPADGRAVVAGFDVRRARAELRGHIGYMSQRFSLYRDQTVLENLRLSAGLYGIPRARRRARIAALLSSLGLEHLADRPPAALPLGVRQRLALASAILHEPPVLFLDEPTAGVDPVARRQFWDLVHLLAHRHGVAVLVSTHYMDEATHCDRLGFMHEGRLVGLGTPSELRARAETTGGPMLSVEAADFGHAFTLLQTRFPDVMLHGRHIRWQTARPEADRRTATEALAAAGLAATVETRSLSMEDTFVSVLRAAGLGRA